MGQDDQVREGRIAAGDGEVSGVEPTRADIWDSKFRTDLTADTAFEAGLLFKELAIVTIIVTLVLLWGVLL